ncbi:hypothetical protein Pdw03_7890 [Penicillium digitatum]|uniref:Uncharacterized protein n=1 Tax=Penicillium digitatum TaxID=36651 RepID=A0A7T6XMS6_PENDI|nr:hypothetical protein Pdw03_7890 [Penicillium digitatum]
MRRFYYGISLGIPAEPLLYTEARTNPITDKALKPTKSQDREEIEGSQMKDLLAGSSKAAELIAVIATS